MSASRAIDFVIEVCYSVLPFQLVCISPRYSTLSLFLQATATRAIMTNPKIPGNLRQKYIQAWRKLREGGSAVCGRI